LGGRYSSVIFYHAEIATKIGIARDLVETEETTIEVAMTANERETGGTVMAKRWKAARETERGGRAEEGGGERMKIEERGVVPAMVEEGRGDKEVGGPEGVAEGTVSSRHNNVQVCA
jgi:hypothetical protein